MELLAEVAVSNWTRAKSGDPSLDPEDTKILLTVHSDIVQILTIVLEPWLKEEFGWQEIERSFHALDWLASGPISPEDLEKVGNSRKEAILAIKQQLLRGLLSFAVKELSHQVTFSLFLTSENAPKHPLKEIPQISKSPLKPYFKSLKSFNFPLNSSSKSLLKPLKLP